MWWPASLKQERPELGMEAELRQEAMEDWRLVDKTVTVACAALLRTSQPRVPSYFQAGACLQLNLPVEPAGELVP